MDYGHRAPARRINTSERDGRFRRRFWVRYAIMDGDEVGDFHNANTLNIGVGGAFVATDDPLPKRTPLLLYLAVPPAGLQIEVRCEVCWVADDERDAVRGMGVRFEGLGRHQLKILQRYFDGVDNGE